MADSTRATVRQRLSRLLGDLIKGTATSGSTTTLVDTVELRNYADSKLIGAHVYTVSGTGSGQERYITANTQSSGTVTVPTWTAVDSTTVYEIHRTWRVDTYNDSINQAINDIRGDGGAMAAKVSDTSLSLTADNTSSSYYYTLPTGFRYIRGILLESTTTGIYDDAVPGDAWHFEKKTAATASADSIMYIVFDRNRWEPLSGKHLRIIGGGVQAEFANDTTDLLSEHLLGYVINKAAYYLLQSVQGLGTPESQANARRAQVFLAGAEDARSHVDHRVPPGAVVVPW